MSPCDKSAVKNTVKVPPPVPSKPKQVGLSGTFPGKSASAAQHTGSLSGLPQSNTSHLPSKQDAPPAATVHPFSPDSSGAKDLHKPQTLTASSIYSMYTQQPTAVQGALNRAQNRNSFVSGEPILFSDLT